MAPLGLNIEDSVWETFYGIKDGMFLDKIYGLRLLLFLLKVFHRVWLSVLLGRGFAGIYWKKDAILAPL